MYITRHLETSLLGLSSIIALKLINRVDHIPIPTTLPTSTSIIKKRYPTLFTGLGTLGEEYQINLQEGAKPYALFTPRNVPIPLRNKVKEDLSRMEQLGVISQVQDPTPWCAGMVVVPKCSGTVRICVNLKPLNECF